MKTSTDNFSEIKGTVMVIDDDPIISGMLNVTLSVAGHTVIETNSGEDALQILVSSLDVPPEVIFVDIDMPGIDGFEVCRRIKGNEDLLSIPVVFLSGRDELEDRMTAYEAGGDDFMSKPFNAEEVVRKAALSIRHRRKETEQIRMNASATSAAISALTSLGETAIPLKFSRRVLGCRNMNSLASLTIETMSSFGLVSQVQLRPHGTTITMTPHGPASPLEESVFEKMRDMGRIFCFRNRMIVNYDSVSILLMNMPIEDDDYCGRIRDHVAIIAEAAELAVDNVFVRVDAIGRAQEMKEISAITRETVDELHKAYRDLQIAARVELEMMTNTLEGMYVGLGLTEGQESLVSNTVRASAGNVIDLLEMGSRLDSKFADIAEQLTMVADVPMIHEEDEAPPPIEIW